MEQPQKKSLKTIPVVPIGKLFNMIPSLYFNTLPAVVKLVAKFGDLIDIKINKKNRVILANHPDYVKYILKTNQDNYSRLGVLGDLSKFLGNGIFASEGKLWEQQHLLLKPVLHEKLVEDYFDQIQKETALLISKWEQKAKENIPVDIEYDINVLMLRVLIKTQFTPEAEEDFDEIIRYLRVILNENNPKRVLVSKLRSQFRKSLNLTDKPKAKYINAFEKIDKIVASIRKTAAQNPYTMGHAMKALEQAKEDGIISDKQVADEIKNFIFAGFDTTASALTWNLYCFAKYKKPSQKLKSELDKVLHQTSITLSKVGEMQYTKMFIQESMRLYPPVYAFFRVCLEEDEMEGYHIPKKTCIAFNLYALHRHPDIWESPEEFIPERFEPSTFKGKAFAYIPFGQGKRSCIGKPLAMIELQIILPLILQKFNLQLVSHKEPKISPDIIIKLKKPIMMNLSLR